jgi:hypothetical protein
VKTKPSFPESGVVFAHRKALENVVHALGDLSEEGRRRIIYAAAVFYGILPIEVPDKRPRTASRVVALEPKLKARKSV